jgi:hypothetical protein
MAGESVSGDAGDPHDLNRFVQAQEDDYAQALAEIRSGRKRSHGITRNELRARPGGLRRFHALKSVAQSVQ